MIIESVDEHNCIFLTNEQAASKDMLKGILDKVTELDMGQREVAKALELLPVFKNNNV